MFDHKIKAAAALTIAATAALAFAGTADAGVAKPNTANQGDVQLISTDGSASLVHTIRHADGTWQNFGRLGAYSGVTSLTSTLVNGEENAFFQYAGPKGPQLAHFIRHVDGTWDYNASVPSTPAGATVDGLAATTVNGQIELVERTGGDLHLSTLGADGAWSTWSSVPTDGHAVRSVALAPTSSNGVLHVVELSSDGKSVGDYDLYPDGSWYGSNWINATPDPAYTATEVAAAYTYGALQVTTVAANAYYSTVFHTIRHDDYSWDNFGDVQQVAGFGGEAQHVSMTYSGGEMQLAFSTQNGGLIHTTRHWDGSWQRVGDVESVAGNINAGLVTLAGYYF
ncbi:hypothetical protein [Kutzneria sp. NPDC052558]|uniref:hypothetical protein n=1 Tax=Kutzneria sp. NPDC052558 TaxID=3364121 RepID=UPI0037CC4F65